MERIYDPVAVAAWLERSKLERCFDTRGLDFHLCRFHKGEKLTGPDAPLGALLFVVQGTVLVYGVRSDGRMVPVNQQHSPVVLGDLEFVIGGKTPFFVEARTAVTCLCLPIAPHRERLAGDVRFLQLLLRAYADKLQFFAFVDAAAATLEERLLLYLGSGAGGGALCGIEAATLRLHCSRRQLQRVVKKLCAEGRLQKTGRGCYRLVPWTGDPTKE